MVEAPGESERCFLRWTFPWTLALLPKPRSAAVSPLVPSGAAADGTRAQHAEASLGSFLRPTGREGSVVCWHMHCSRHFTDILTGLGSLSPFVPM